MVFADGNAHRPEPCRKPGPFGRFYLQELINSGSDPDELQAFVDTLRANDAALSEAIKARTAAVGEPAPVPVEPMVQPEA